MKPMLKTIALLGLGTLCAPIFAADVQSGPAGVSDYAEPARPGTVNYVEGAARLDGRSLNQRDVGSIAMEPGQELTTGNGKAEVLLTPGIFLRVGSNSEVKMISPDLAETQVELDRGRAGVEVDQIFSQNNVQIIDRGVATQLLKTGYYEFDANRPEAMVFSGKAKVDEGDNRWETVKGHHEVALDDSGAKQKTMSFDTHPENDQLYNWSRLRSKYLEQADSQIAPEYAGAYPGWYWDPYVAGYAFLGVDPFYSPFGWGYYPWGGYWGGYYAHPWYGRGRVYGGGFRGGRGVGGGFHGGSGGGFHGGGGGRR